MSSVVGVGLARHRLDVEMKLEVRMIDRVHQPRAFGAGVDEVGLRRRQRFHADGDAAVGDGRHRRAEGFNGVGKRLIPEFAGGQRPLLGRSEDHQITAEVARRFGQRNQVVGRFASARRGRETSGTTPRCARAASGGR